MIAIPLPFTLGKVVGVNPWSFENEWEHPILRIGSSFSEPKPEVYCWLYENCKDGWQFGHNNRTYELRFDSEGDATMFALRWL